MKHATGSQTAVPSALEGAEVSYAFSCQRVHDSFVVTGFSCVEELNRPYRLTVNLTAEDEATDSTDLLGQDVTFRIERDHTYERVFCGLVDCVTVIDAGRTLQSCTITVVPALAALNRTVDTCIFQGKTALEVVRDVLARGLAPYRREFNFNGVEASRLVARDYCVQYRESNLNFVHRLLEEEGIGYGFVHGETEELTLFDDNRHIERAPTTDGGPARYDSTGRHRAGAEPIQRFQGSARRTSTSITTRDHDWTRATTQQLQQSASINAPAPNGVHDVYEHGLEHHLVLHEHAELAGAMLQTLSAAALPNGLPAGIEHRVHSLAGAVFDSFTSNNLDDRARVRSEWHGRDYRTFEGRSLIRGLSPGRSFELIGHPTLGSDGEYFITKIIHGSSVEDVDEWSSDANETNYSNRFECLPLSTPWRPDRPNRKPRIHSIQTAKVTGPVGLDVHTDPHGRIRVRFPWDRAGESLLGDNSCWIRVSQPWAGAGSPGFSFIPRVGMEVIVAFIDGDPDRPLVTGCVYNGENPTPGFLPIQATKSIIRTRTVPHGAGHNELSFEDAMGRERVHIRAQRDLDELVLHDHITDVRGNRTRSVARHEYSHVGGNQNAEVRGERNLSTVGADIRTSLSDFTHTVNGSADTVVTDNYHLEVTGGTYTLEVDEGECITRSRGPIALEHNEVHFIQLSSEQDEEGVLVRSGESLVHVSEQKIELRIGDSSIVMTENVIQINGKTFPAIPESD